MHSRHVEIYFMPDDSINIYVSTKWTLDVMGLKITTHSEPETTHHF